MLDRSSHRVVRVRALSGMGCNRMANFVTQMQTKASPAAPGRLV